MYCSIMRIFRIILLFSEIRRGGQYDIGSVRLERTQSRLLFGCPNMRQMKRSPEGLYPRETFS